MSKVARLLHNWRDPDFWSDDVVPYVKNIPERSVYQLYSRVVHGDPVNVIDEDWDNLFILDACRYDVFSEVNWLAGELESRISKASVTGNFLTKNFPETYPEVVYISANPHASRLVSDRFHAFVPAWDTHWDDEKGTVPPDAMSEAVRDAAREYPNKRLIAHYVQPHEPYVGPKALEKFGTEYEHGMMAARERAETGNVVRSPKTSVTARYRNGKLSRDEVLKVYRENLEIALEQVAELTEEISGKSVISSDHGEMFDEIAWPIPRRRIGHWGGVRSTELVKVPWLVLPFEDRKEIVEGSIQKAPTGSEQQYREKLRSLGYLQ